MVTALLFMAREQSCPPCSLATFARRRHSAVGLPWGAPGIHPAAGPGTPGIDVESAGTGMYGPVAVPRPQRSASAAAAWTAGGSRSTPSPARFPQRTGPASPRHVGLADFSECDPAASTAADAGRCGGVTGNLRTARCPLDPAGAVRPPAHRSGRGTRNGSSLDVEGRSAVKTHCANGHEYTQANTHVLPDGSRRCRACVANNRRREAEAKREGRQLVRATPIERFWRTFKRDPSSGCWTWLGSLNADGYGSFSIKKKRQGAHRFAYQALVGPIPEGLQLDHLCRNRACVNPSHLEPVTPKVNTLRSAAAQATKTHCIRGHEFTPANTRLRSRPDGRSFRSCIACERHWEAVKTSRRRAQKAVALQFGGGPAPVRRVRPLQPGPPLTA